MQFSIFLCPPFCFSHASAYFHPPPHQLPQPKKKAILLCIIYNPGFNKLKCYLVDEVSFISQFAGEMSHYRSELRCSTLSLSLFICFLCPRITFSATKLSKQRTKSKKLLKKTIKKVIYITKLLHCIFFLTADELRFIFM